MTFVKDLTLNQLNLLVARFEGVAVVIHKDHVAEELTFNPEGPANDYANDNSKMWLFYEPASDWKITGPILERERINISTYDGEEAQNEASYWGAWYADYQFECTSDTATEAIIRSFIAKHYGDAVDLDNLPIFKRTAIVKVDYTIIERIWEAESLDDIFKEAEVQVIAETVTEAEAIVTSRYTAFFNVHASFRRWI